MCTNLIKMHKNCNILNFCHFMRERAKESFGNSPVNITTEGKRHLGAVIGSQQYKDLYCKEKVESWKSELETLALIAETEPQSAYAAYTKAYKSKFIYFQRTIESFEEYLEPIDSLLFGTFIPTLFGREEPVDLPKELIALSPNDGGLGIEMISGNTKKQFEASKNKTRIHVETIKQQSLIMNETGPDGRTKSEIDGSIKKTNVESRKAKFNDLVLGENLKQFVDQARDTGASSWLNALPIREQQLDLNKEQFNDSLLLRYNLPLSGLKSFCECGSPFSVTHALDCKKGGFMAQRHDNLLRDLLTHLLSKI